MHDGILLETKRLYVRHWRESDLEEFYRMMSDKRVHLFTGEKPWSLEYVQTFIRWHRHDIDKDDGFFNLPMLLKENSRLIGRVGLNPYWEDRSLPELELTIGAEYWGKGFATEISREMFHYAFEKAGFSMIVSFVIPENIGSARVMEKLGMRLIGTKTFWGNVWNFYSMKKADYLQGVHMHIPLGEAQVLNNFHQ